MPTPKPHYLLLGDIDVVECEHLRGRCMIVSPDVYDEIRMLTREERAREAMEELPRQAKQSDLDWRKP